MKTDFFGGRKKIEFHLGNIMSNTQKKNGNHTLKLSFSIGSAAQGGQYNGNTIKLGIYGRSHSLYLVTGVKDVKGFISKT